MARCACVCVPLERHAAGPEQVKENAQGTFMYVFKNMHTTQFHTLFLDADTDMYGKCKTGLGSNQKLQNYTVPEEGAKG